MQEGGSSRGAIPPTQSSRSARGKRRSEHASSVDLRKSHRGGVCSRRKACEHDCKRQGSTPKSREAISKGPTPCKGSTWVPRSAPRKLENRLLEGCHVKWRAPAQAQLFLVGEVCLRKPFQPLRSWMLLKRIDRSTGGAANQTRPLSSPKNARFEQLLQLCSCRLPPLAPPSPPSLYLPRLCKGSRSRSCSSASPRTCVPSSSCQDPPF